VGEVIAVYAFPFGDRAIVCERYTPGAERFEARLEQPPAKNEILAIERDRRGRETLAPMRGAK
jgi:hypothetical protein